MQKRDRTLLLFRKNCEGYFVDNKGNILAARSPHGFVLFPGGGIDAGETPEEGMLRETLEETGAIVGDLKLLDIITFTWEKDWAKTEKQKKRYEEFQGDEMYFFSGTVKSLKEGTSVKEDHWGKDKFLPLNEVISLLKLQLQPNDTDRSYRRCQLHFLNFLLRKAGDVIIHS